MVCKIAGFMDSTKARHILPIFIESLNIELNKQRINTKNLVMNIICNNCIGARMYEVSKIQFPNPFMWNAINAYDFIKLMKDYEKIDLYNPKIELEQYLKQEHKSVLVTLSNDVKLHFIHYMQDETKEQPIKEKSTNILYKDIISYAKEKWYKRVDRSKEQPTFMFAFNYMKKNDKLYTDILEKLLKTKKNLIIIMHDSFETPQVSSNIKIMKFDDDTMSLDAGLSKIIANILFNKK